MKPGQEKDGKTDPPEENPPGATPRPRGDYKWLVPGGQTMRELQDGSEAEPRVVTGELGPEPARPARPGVAWFGGGAAGSGTQHLAASGEGDPAGGPLPPVEPGAPPNAVESWIVTGTTGSGHLTLASGNATSTVPFTIVDATQLTKIDVTLMATVLGPDASVDSFVNAEFFTAAGPVYGLGCTWTASDSSVEVLNPTKPDQLDLQPYSTVDMRMTQDGNFMATCTLGQFAVSVPISRQ